MTVSTRQCWTRRLHDDLATAGLGGGCLQRRRVPHSQPEACKSPSLQTLSIGGKSQIVGAKEQGPKRACGRPLAHIKLASHAGVADGRNGPGRGSVVSRRIGEPPGDRNVALDPNQAPIEISVFFDLQDSGERNAQQSTRFGYLHFCRVRIRGSHELLPSRKMPAT